MATITFTVTVATGTNGFSAGANKFFINGTVSPVLELQEGNTYIFDQSEGTNENFIFALSSTKDGTNTSGGVAYTTGVTTTGTPGNAGAKTTIVVAPVQAVGAPTLFYYCAALAGMGNQANTVTASSGTNTFNPAIDDIIEEAFERTNIRGTRTGYQLRSARRSLNIMFKEWENRGVHLWKVKYAQIPLIEGQAEYNYAKDSVNFPNDLSQILEATYRNNSTTTNPADQAMTQISRSQYSATANKLTKGTPSQYYIDRKINPSIFLYATPSSSVSSTSTPSSFQFCFYYMAQVDNAGDYTNTADVVDRFFPCMMSGLAYYLSMKFSPGRTPELERIYQSEMARALDADNQGTSTYISPQTFYGDGVSS